MKRLFLILLFVPSLAFATITDRFVTDAGAGSGDGSSEANAMSFATFTDYMSTGGSFTATAGDRFNIKGAITSRTTTVDTWVNGGTVASPVIVRGYNSTIGDLTTLARTNGNGDLVTTNYPSITYTTGNIVISGSFIILEAVKVTSANTSASGGTIKAAGSDIYIKRCSVTNSSTNANAIGVLLNAARDVLVDSDVALTGASGGLAAVDMGTTTRAIGCRIKGNQSAGIRMETFTAVAAFNTIYSSTGNGISLVNTASSATVLYNTIVGGSADGINMVTGSTITSIFIGNMITDNTGDGIDMVSTSNGAYASANRFRDNHDNTPTYPAGWNNSGDWITATNYGAVTSGNGTSDYIGGSGSSGDYRLLLTSPGVAAGSPLFAAIGALQNATPTPTATSTPTNTPTPTPTATATASFTPCAPTPTATATFTPTSTPTPSDTPTPTATVFYSGGRAG